MREGNSGVLVSTIETFESVANVTAFFAVSAGLAGLLGRVIETIRIQRSTNISKEDRDIRLQDATTLGSVLGIGCAAATVVLLLIA